MSIGRKIIPVMTFAHVPHGQVHTSMGAAPVVLGALVLATLGGVFVFHLRAVRVFVAHLGQGETHATHAAAVEVGVAVTFDGFACCERKRGEGQKTVR